MRNGIVTSSCFAWNYVVPKDCDIIVTVRAVLLVEEAKGVHQLVDGSAHVHASFRIQGETLRPAVHAHGGPAPTGNIVKAV